MDFAARSWSLEILERLLRAHYRADRFRCLQGHSGKLTSYKFSTQYRTPLRAPPPWPAGEGALTRLWLVRVAGAAPPRSPLKNKHPTLHLRSGSPLLSLSLSPSPPQLLARSLSSPLLFSSPLRESRRESERERGGERRSGNEIDRLLDLGMQSGDMKFSAMDLMSAILTGKYDGEGLPPEFLGIAGNRELLAVITTSVAVLLGCAILLLWRRSKKATPAFEPPQPPPGRGEPMQEVDDGRKKVTVFFGTRPAPRKISNANGYLERTFLSPGSIRFRDLIMSWMQDAGLKIWVDQMGNLHGRTEAANAMEETLLIGSKGRWRNFVGQ